MPTPFVSVEPTLENQWRALILFGRNVASYKFALGRTLLGLAREADDFVPLEDLAAPYARHICEHLGNTRRQGTFAKSRFLDACASFNEGKLTKDQLLGETVRRGFNNVIDAFHVLDREELPGRFFVDERRGPKKGIRLTAELRSLSELVQFQNLPAEVEARWRLVETAWDLGLPKHVVAVSFDRTTERLYADTRGGRRRDITGCRDALNGYQRGRCFYCRRDVSLSNGGVDVDHFLPRTLAQAGFETDLDGVWNLVLACIECNRGPQGKWTRVPELRFLQRLYERGEHLIASHHPLRETLMLQTGSSAEARRSFLQARWTVARERLIHLWRPAYEETPAL